MKFFQWFNDLSTWQQELPITCLDDVKVEQSSDCANFKFDSDFVEKIRPTVEVVLLVQAILSFIMDLAVYKWRFIANYYIYFESIALLGYTLIPAVDLEVVSSLILNCLWIAFFISYYTDQRMQIIWIAIVHAIMIFGVEEFLYDGTLMDENILIKLLFYVAMNILFILLGVLYLYMISLNDKMTSTIMQNMKILNGMHEGVLILSKQDDSIMFCNNPA